MPPQEIEHFGLTMGTLDVIPIDAGGNPTAQIWDRTAANRLDCTIVLTDPLVHTYHNADDFELVAYFDPLATGGAVVPVPAAAVAFQGNAGAIVGTGAARTLTFAPLAVPSCSIWVPASDPSLPAGPYRVTVVLTHTPDPLDANPRIAGFYDMGIIQLFEP
jgi:hypothetical protein